MNKWPNRLFYGLDEGDFINHLSIYLPFLNSEIVINSISKLDARQENTIVLQIYLQKGLIIFKVNAESITDTQKHKLKKMRLSVDNMLFY